MLPSFCLRERAGFCLLAPGMMMIMMISQWATGTEGALEGNRTIITAGSPHLLPASENTTQGLPAGLEVSFQLAATALVFATFSGCGITMPFCHPQKLRIRGKAWIWLGIYANGLAGLASAMALVALVLWSYNQGFPAILIVPIILLLHVTAVTLLIVVTIVFQLDVLHKVTDRRAQHMLDLTAPGGVILVIMTLGVLMKHICQLQEKKCVRTVDLTAVIAGAAGMCLLPFLAILAAYCLDMKQQATEEPGSRREKRMEGLHEEKIILP